jgi:hypothetical protein
MNVHQCPIQHVQVDLPVTADQMHCLLWVVWGVLYGPCGARGCDICFCAAGQLPSHCTGRLGMSQVIWQQPILHPLLLRVVGMFAGA